MKGRGVYEVLNGRGRGEVGGQAAAHLVPARRAVRARGGAGARVLAHDAASAVGGRDGSGRGREFAAGALQAQRPSRLRLRTEKNAGAMSIHFRQQSEDG